MTSAGSLELRSYKPEDEPAVIGLLQLSLGWATDRRHEQLFRWKHEQGPWGRSPAWVAVVDGQVVGFRAFMRWQFQAADGTISAVRAVDTATHPEYRGRGIFRELTLHALEALRQDRIAFVFNTPNDQSRPGYLKMGWQVLGRVPARVRLCRVGGLARMSRARTSADLWSLESDVGLPAPAALEDEQGVSRLLEQQPPAPRISTDRTIAYLAWRYGLGLLRYRALLLGPTAADGLLIFRLRRRGGAVEAVLAELLVPGNARRAAAMLTRQLTRQCRADYILSLAQAPQAGGPLLPVPWHGPLLTWRGICETTPRPLRAHRLTMGDLEMF